MRYGSMTDTQQDGVGFGNFQRYVASELFADAPDSAGVTAARRFQSWRPA